MGLLGHTVPVDDGDIVYLIAFQCIGARHAALAGERQNIID